MSAFARRDRQCDPKQAARLSLRHERHRAAVEPDRPSGNGQAEPGSPSSLRAIFVDAVKALEDVRSMLDRNTGPIVIDFNECAALDAASNADGDAPALGRVLNGVSDQIDQRLLERRFVDPDG